MAEQPGMVFVNCSASKCVFWDDGLCTADVIDITSEGEGIKCATYQPAIDDEAPAQSPQPSPPTPRGRPPVAVNSGPAVPPPPTAAAMMRARMPERGGLVPPPPPMRRM